MKATVLDESSDSPTLLLSFAPWRWWCFFSSCTFLSSINEFITQLLHIFPSFLVIVIDRQATFTLFNFLWFCWKYYIIWTRTLRFFQNYETCTFKYDLCDTICSVFVSCRMDKQKISSCSRKWRWWRIFSILSTASMWKWKGELASTQVRRGHTERWVTQPHWT